MIHFAQSVHLNPKKETLFNVSSIAWTCPGVIAYEFMF